MRTASVVWWSEILATEWRYIVLPVRYELNLYMVCIRKLIFPVAPGPGFYSVSNRNEYQKY
jgi:hypothetical protein